MAPYMPNITFAIPEGLYKKMKKHKEIRWSEVVLQVISRRIKDLEFVNSPVSSDISDEEIDRLSKKINRSAAKKLGL